MPFEINFNSTQEEVEAKFGDAIIIHDGVESVNGKTGIVTLNADDVGAVPAGEYDPDAKTDAMTQAVGVDENGKLWTAPGGGGSDLFICTSGTTTYAEITAAVADGLLPVLYYNGSALVFSGTSSSTHYFYNSDGTTIISATVNSSNTWGFNTRAIPTAYTSNPADLGTKSPGSSAAFARGDHVHETQVFVATYGTTTNAQIEAAYQAGKICVVNYNGKYYVLTERTSATRHFFTAARINTIYSVNCDNDVWATTSKAIVSKSDNLPQALGTASAGNGASVARDDHVHPMPSASDVGAVAVAQGVAHAGEFVVVGSDGNITTVTMTAWSGGSY